MAFGTWHSGSREREYTTVAILDTAFEVVARIVLNNGIRSDSCKEVQSKEYIQENGAAFQEHRHNRDAGQLWTDLGSFVDELEPLALQYF